VLVLKMMGTSRHIKWHQILIRRFAGVFVGLFFSDWWVSRNARDTYHSPKRRSDSNEVTPTGASAGF
jgi:hypothetical protein